MRHLLAGKELGNGLDDTRLTSAALAADKQVKLGNPPPVATYSVQLPAYQSERDALHSIESETLRKLPPRLGKRRGRPEADARRRLCATR